MQIDAQRVRQHELDGAHHVVGARTLAHPKVRPASRHRRPVDPGGVELGSVVAPVRQRLHVLGGEIARTVADHLGRERVAHQILGHVPVGVEHGVAYQAGHHRRLLVRLADDDAHGPPGAAVLEQPQPAGRDVDQDEAAAGDRGQGARPHQVGRDQPLIRRLA